MKVKIKDLEPNPFRDMKNYPINSEKIESLKNSINQTGFWDNILARKNNDKIQIAYGHHRFIVLQRNFKPDHIIDIPVRNLDDATMIKIMANENMQNWTVTPAIIDETIKTTREFLFKNPEIVRELDTSTHKEKRGFDKSKPIGAVIITKFLGENWKMDWVSSSLLRLRMVEEDELDKKAIDSMPSPGAARDFVEAVKWSKPSKETQKKVAKKIVDSRKGESETKGIYGKYRIEEEMFEEEHGEEARKREGKRRLEEEERRRQFEYYLIQVKEKAESLKRSLVSLLEYKDILLSDYYQKSKEGQDFIYAMANLFDTFRILMIKKGKESDLIESFKLLIESKKKEEE